MPKALVFKVFGFLCVLKKLFRLRTDTERKSYIVSACSVKGRRAYSVFVDMHSKEAGGNGRLGVGKPVDFGADKYAVVWRGIETHLAAQIRISGAAIYLCGGKRERCNIK